MTIFYRDRLGKYPYLSRDGRKVNGGIPQLGDLAAHLALTVTQMSGLLQPNFTGLAVIDWEEWRPLWERNFGSKMVYRKLSKELVRQERPDLSDRAVKLMARQKFEESARKFMEETLRSVVTDRPKGLWGFYGFPACFNQQKRKTGRTNTNCILSSLFGGLCPPLYQYVMIIPFLSFKKIKVEIQIPEHKVQLSGLCFFLFHV